MFLKKIIFMMKNRTNPSKHASYNWDGCLIMLSTFGKITPQNTLVVLPTSSPFIKLAIRPKNIPTGETQAIMSNKKSDNIFLFKENKYVPIIIPIKAPWKDMPPSQIFIISNGFEI